MGVKTLFVGDIHGKVDIVKQVLDMEYPVVFVGDLLDSYEYTTDKHLKCLELIFKAIDEGKARCLYGNHELSYFYPHMRCSGWRSDIQMHINGGLKKEIENRFGWFILKNNVLVSHAGLTKQLWDDQQLTLELLPQILIEWTYDSNSPMFDIGAVRGGLHPYGGMFWCDWNHEFTPVPELIQIVGHTRGKDIRTKENNYCIDCLDFQHSNKENFLIMEI